MSPAEHEERLLDAVCEIDSIRALVDLGGMATADLEKEQREPLAQLLSLISDRLKEVNDMILPKRLDTAA